MLLVKSGPRCPSVVHAAMAHATPAHHAASTDGTRDASRRTHPGRLDDAKMNDHSAWPERTFIPLNTFRCRMNGC
jgi:hypothetical protein